jgi:nucleotide-binding universal stress UspA family protein
MASRHPATSADLLSSTAPAPILIGFDGSDGGRDALELGRLLSSIEGSRCIVAFPHDLGLAEEARMALGDPRAEAEEIGVLLPSMMLVQSANRHRAGTLVVGSTRRGRVGRILLGSDVEQILHKDPCDVLVAPSGYASEGRRGFAKVVVAVDGMPDSEAVLARAEGLAHDAGAALQDIPTATSNAGSWWHGVGTTASEIAEACLPDADLLVVGWRHRMDHFRAGSVTKHLITEAPCPVLVVPNPR